VGIDDCHATGHLGPTGRGGAEELGVLNRIDVITGTLGKTLGGASGGFTASSAEIVDWLRNRSRPYLFSNSVPPALVAAGMKALELVDSASELRAKLKANTAKLRAALEAAVVPHGQARIRMQVSAAHTPEQIDRAIAAFTEVGKQLGVLK
jgi:glycine C-acetyltransferase